MKNVVLIFLLVNSFICFGQTKDIQVEIKSKNIFDLSIIKVYPDSFPNVSVIFQAQNKFGKPLWKLDKSELNVEENFQKCKVRNLLNVSKEKPLHIGLVFDHSFSMLINPIQLDKYREDLRDYVLKGTPIPKGYIMPIDYAKKGVVGFLEASKRSTDSIMFVGFSTTVDEVSPLTDDVSKIKSILKGVQPKGDTAFIDALFYTIETLSKGSGRFVIVALTDGQDTSSKHSVNDVIELSKSKNVSIYTIGLGNVNGKLLKQISEETDGFYYHTNKPKKLKEIYSNIKEQLTAIYQVDYVSNNLDYLNNERNIRFSFVNDTLQFADNTETYSLPEDVISYLKKKESERMAYSKQKESERIAYLNLQEEERKSSERNKLIMVGLGVLLLGAGSFLVYKGSKKPTVDVVVSKVYPNPFESQLTIEYKSSKEAGNTKIKIFDASGNQVFEKHHVNSSGKEQLNLEKLESGMYIVKIFDGETISKTTKVLKK